MKYGQRLKQARLHAKLNQPQLSQKLNGIVSQQNISHLENGDATGSEYTVQFALACGVDPIWLATETGEMIPSADLAYAKNEKQARVLAAMQEMSEYKQDVLVGVSDSLTKPEGNHNNG